MIDALLFIGYFIGWLWGLRFVLRIAIADFHCLEPIDFLISMLLAAGWPILLIGRLVYVGWVKYVPEFSIEESGFLSPLPKPETYRERQNRKLLARAEELDKRERWVVEREKELR